MKTHSYRLMAIIIMMALMGAQETVRATSYSYPFATEFSFKPKLGESIAAVLESIYSDFRKRDDLKYVDHASASLQIAPELKKVVCTVEREYKGQLGEAIFEFLFDYGCGMEIIDPTRSDGPSYTLRICRIDPSEKFTVIVPTPEPIRNALNIDGAGLADALRKAGLKDEECTAAKITPNMGQIYATAKMSAIARLWAYNQCARRQAEQAGAGQPATRPESKSEGSDKPQPESEGLNARPERKLTLSLEGGQTRTVEIPKGDYLSEDGTLTLYPGDTVHLEFDEGEEGASKPHIVSEVKDPERTITFAMSQKEGITTLARKTKMQKTVAMDCTYRELGAERFSVENLRPTEKGHAFTSWPGTIWTLRLSDFEVSNRPASDVYRERFPK